jgi:hypothetical protein
MMLAVAHGVLRQSGAQSQGGADARDGRRGSPPFRVVSNTLLELTKVAAVFFALLIGLYVAMERSDEHWRRKFNHRLLKLVSPIGRIVLSLLLIAVLKWFPGDRIARMFSGALVFLKFWPRPDAMSPARMSRTVSASSSWHYRMHLGFARECLPRCGWRSVFAVIPREPDGEELQPQP